MSLTDTFDVGKSEMLALIAMLVGAVLATSNVQVETRTGTFLGGLNDTYPDVRQFKWVPFAKVGLAHETD